jgi:hypothetical protein
MKLPPLFLLPLLLPVTLASGAPPENELSLRVESFSLTSVSPDGAQAEMHVTARTGVDAKIEHLAFSNVHANGIPFFAKPIDTAIELHHGEDVALPPIAVSVYFHDLDSLTPLIQVLQDGKARVRAEVDVTVHASMLQHLFLGTARPLAVLGGGSALALLSGAQALLGSGSDGGGGLLGALGGLLGGSPPGPASATSGGLGPRWKAQMDAEPTALLHGHSCFTPAKKGSDETCIDQLAFLTAPAWAISSAELGAPWRFDPALARALADHGGKVQAGDPRITVAAGLDRSAADVSVSATFRATGEAPGVSKIVLPSHTQLELEERAAPGVYGRLELPSAGQARAFAVAPGAVRNQPRWEQLVVFRLIPGRDGSWSARPITLSGTAEGGAITFSHPVDRSASGSPILTPEGVVGVVQSETGGTLLAREP